MSETIQKYTDKYSQWGQPAKGLAIKAKFDTDAKAIRAHTGLTPDGKRVEIAKKYVEARHQIDTLQNEFRANVSKARTDLQRQVFGAPDPSAAGLMAHRDARGRAQALNDKDAATQELAYAHMVGDTSLARAITQKASEKGWTEVIAAQDSHYTGTKATLDAIRDLPDHTDRDSKTMQDNFFAMDKPQEFRSLAVSTDALPEAERLVRAHEQEVAAAERSTVSNP